MSDQPADSTADKNRDVSFQPAYKGIPKVVLYGMIPFLFLGSGALFVHAVWFDGGITIKGFKLSPETVDWSIKEFLPGAIRGNQKLARRAIGRIQARENN